MRKLALLGCAAGGAAIVACWDRVVAPEGPTYPPVFDTGPVKVDFCADSIPTWFAYKDGDSAWKTMIPDPAGTVEFTPTTSKIGIAFVQDGASSTRRRTTVWFVSSLEARHLTGANCIEQNGPNSLTATIVPTGPDKFVFSVADSTRANQPSIALGGLPSHKVDAMASSTDGGLAVVIQRDVTPGSGTALPPFDLSSAVANHLTPYSKPADWGGLSFTTRNGTVQFVAGFVPAPLLQIGDLHRMYFSPISCGSGVCLNYGARFAERFSYQGSATAVPSGASFTAIPAVTLASAAPYAQPRLQLPVQPDYATGVAVTVTNPAPRPNSPFVPPYTAPYMSVVWTSAFLGGAPTSWDVTFPDLSGIAGWQPEYGIPYVPTDGSGPHTFAHVQAFAGRYPRPLPIPPHAGDVLRWIEYSKPIP